jgi:hypothetical protein
VKRFDGMEFVGLQVALSAENRWDESFERGVEEECRQWSVSLRQEDPIGALDFSFFIRVLLALF